MEQVIMRTQEGIPDRLLDIRQASFKTRISKTVIYELLKTGGFPAKIKFGRMTRFSENEIDAWIAEAKLNRVS